MVTVAFASMMGSIAAALTGQNAQGVAIASSTAANAAQNNYMAHYSEYAANLESCRKNPDGTNCSAILKMTDGTRPWYIGQTDSGYRVAANVGAQGAASYTVVSPSGDMMLMEPREWGVFTQMSPEMQSDLFGQSQWALDFSSYVDYAMIGNTGKSLSNFWHMFTTGSYWQEMGLNLGLGMVGSRAFTAKMLGPRVVPVNAERSFTFNAIENPGPLASLPGKPAANFFGGKYNQSVLTEDLVLYRGGEAGKPLGQWFTREAPDSVAQMRIDSAVKPQWVDPKTGVLTGSSKIDTVYAVKIPKGATVYDGPVGYQGGVHLGGPSTNQVFVSTPWNIKGVQVLGETPIK